MQHTFRTASSHAFQGPGLRVLSAFAVRAVPPGAERGRRRVDVVGLGMRRVRRRDPE